MNASAEEQQNRVFQALADPTRRQILKIIASRDVSVAEIGKPFDISAPAISKHLKVLENAELIERIKDGKRRRFRMNTAPLHEAKNAIAKLASYWSHRLDALNDFLNAQTPEPHQPEKRP